MAALTKTDIANIASDFLGEPPIDGDISAPTTKLEALYNRHYEKCREEVLCEHTWNFAMSRAVITRSGDAPFDYTDSYTLPADFGRFISIEGDEEIEYEKDYDFHNGREVLYNGSAADSIKVRYIRNETDLSKWAPLARKALALNLAAAVCYAITKSNTRTKDLESKYEIELRKAKAVDTTERPPHKRSDSSIKRRRQFFAGGGATASVFETLD